MTSVAGHTYRLQYRDTLSGSWTSLPDRVATGPTLTVTNVVGGALQRYYRAQVVK
jgi:hypothetical protein